MYQIIRRHRWEHVDRPGVPLFHDEVQLICKSYWRAYLRRLWMELWRMDQAFWDLVIEPTESCKHV